VVAAVTPSLTADIFTLPLAGGHHLVYAPLSRAAFIGNARAVNVLADLKAGQPDAGADPDGGLVQFLQGLELLDAGPPPERPPLTPYEGAPAPTTVTLFLTTACNLRCTYCYASAGDTPRQYMDLAVAQRGIDFVAKNAALRHAGRFAVAYHGGGEPSLNWRTLTQSLAYARDRAKPKSTGPFRRRLKPCSHNPFLSGNSNALTRPKNDGFFE
jgi:uncharacterized protein